MEHNKSAAPNGGGVAGQPRERRAKILRAAIKSAAATGVASSDTVICC
jgi:hypothetical protein